MATIADNLLAIAAAKSGLADNLALMGVPSVDTEPLQDLVDKVATIPSTDTSDATGLEADIKAGKTVYLADGKKHTGTMENYNQVSSLSDSLSLLTLSDAVTLALTDV